MRKVLAFLAMVFLIGIASANTALNFQQPADFSEQITCYGYATTECTWVQSTTGGNNYVHVSAPTNGQKGGIRNAEAYPMDYSAATFLQHYGDGFPYVILYDSSLNYVWGSSIPSEGRAEVKVVGGVATVYSNGIAGHNSNALAQNPSYVLWGGYGNSPGAEAEDIDNVVFGSSQVLLANASDKYVFGVPETTGDGNPYYYIMKDFTNPSASGFYNGSGSLLNSYSLLTTYGKGSGENDTIEFLGYGIGSIYLRNYTGTSYAGNIGWNLTAFFEQNPPYGLYAVHSPSSLVYSDLILYMGNGATIAWDKSSYATGESGAIITVVNNGAYWDTGTYDYRVDIIDVFGTVDATYPVILQTSTISHQWDEDQDIGAYYAIIMATPKSTSCMGGGVPNVGGTETCADAIWMNAALTNVDAFLNIEGYVFNAQTELPISGAVVNVTQGIDSYITTTITDGNYSASGLSQGGTITINASATGYETYLHQFTPLRVGSLELNITLMPTSPTYSGIALGGIAREPPYNRTIGSALVSIENASDGHYYYTTTNSVGYYIQNNMSGPSHWFDIWGSKSGFTNSSIYQKLVVGS